MYQYLWCGHLYGLPVIFTRETTLQGSVCFSWRGITSGMVAKLKIQRSPLGKVRPVLNPIALRKPKILWSSGHSKSNRVKYQ